jgi:hypothetical protein
MATVTWLEHTAFMQALKASNRRYSQAAVHFISSHKTKKILKSALIVMVMVMVEWDVAVFGRGD